MNLLSLNNYDIKIGDGAPLVVMAGLNVLEDEGLAMEVCRIEIHLRRFATALYFQSQF